MVVEQGPCEAAGVRLLQKEGEACEKLLPVLTFKKDVAPFDASDNDVMKKAGNIYTGITWHAKRITGNVKFPGTSPSPPF